MGRLTQNGSLPIAPRQPRKVERGGTTYLQRTAGINADASLICETFADTTATIRRAMLTLLQLPGDVLGSGQEGDAA